ncbi:MAG: hypothetical protein AB8B79_11080 [Granulosicoccus sp.]
MKLIRLVAVTALLLTASHAHAMPVEDVSAEAVGSNTVRVSWSAAEGAAYYELYLDSAQIQTGITTTAVDVSSLNADTAYQFFVTACMADGMCSAASSQANVSTPAAMAAMGVCEPATDGSAPTVAIEPNGDGTAVLSWCEVSGAEGYNIFLGDQYQLTLGSSTYQLTVDFNEGDEYQVAWYAGSNYPAKSAVAQAPDSETPPATGTDLDILAALEANSSGSDDDVEIYFTRHAEKMTQLMEQEDGSFIEVCGEDKCAEVLNAKGELRAELLADLFRNAGVTERLTHAFSSHKIRTRQTIEMITADAGLSGDMDKNPDDGIQEFPVSNPDGTADATELDPESTSPSEAPVIEALLALPAGSVALVAGHSGTLYDIMAGIGLTDVCFEDTVDTCNESRYPISSSFKVKNFGDIWKVSLQSGEANFIYRVNFQPLQLDIDDLAQ